MGRHCRECGKLMQLRHSTFRRPGGYKCINRKCPESDIFRYKTVNGDLMISHLRALKLQQVLE